MPRYVYGYDIDVDDNEVFFRFPDFPEIISALPLAIYENMNAFEIEAHVDDAVTTALQAIISAGDIVPEPADARLVTASGFLHLNSTKAMKLQLYRVYCTSKFKSISAFARRIGKPDTTARRLLNLRHRSVTDEIDDAMRTLGKVLEHQWDVGIAPPAPPKVREKV